MALKFYSAATHKLRYWLLHKLPTCKEMVPLMSASLDRRLSLREAVELKLHLWICIWCVWYLEQLETMRDVLRRRSTRTDEVGLPEVTLSDEARARLKQSLEKHKGV